MPLNLIGYSLAPGGYIDAEGNLHITEVSLIPVPVAERDKSISRFLSAHRDETWRLIRDAAPEED